MKCWCPLVTWTLVVAVALVTVPTTTDARSRRRPVKAQEPQAQQPVNNNYDDYTPPDEYYDEYEEYDDTKGEHHSSYIRVLYM